MPFMHKYIGSITFRDRFWLLLIGVIILFITSVSWTMWWEITFVESNGLIFPTLESVLIALSVMFVSIVW